jgi:hypothetical protein
MHPNFPNSCTDTCSANIIFQNSLDAISGWCNDWQLPISTSKSGWMIISNKHSISNDTNFVLGGCALQKLSEVKDLGVYMDNKLHFSKQITAVVSKAKQRLYLLKKCFVACSVDKLILGFKLYVLPILDYCSSVWSPHCAKDIVRLESVQRGFTKKLSGYKNLSYAERLTRAGLCSLELRRLRTDLCVCYKILHSQIHVNSFFVMDNVNATRVRSWKIKANRPRLDTM